MFAASCLPLVLCRSLLLAVSMSSLLLAFLACPAGSSSKRGAPYPGAVGGFAKSALRFSVGAPNTVAREILRSISIGNRGLWTTLPPHGSLDWRATGWPERTTDLATPSPAPARLLSPTSNPMPRPFPDEQRRALLGGKWVFKTPASRRPGIDGNKTAYFAAKLPPQFSQKAPPQSSLPPRNAH